MAVLMKLYGVCLLSQTNQETSVQMKMAGPSQHRIILKHRHETGTLDLSEKHLLRLLRGLSPLTSMQSDFFLQSQESTL